MPKAAKDVVEKRPEEIIEACRKLYRIKSFSEITLKDISVETSLSRPSIYNYFQTKEEIFLAVLKEEYRYWNKDLRKILETAEPLSVESFAEAIALSLKKRTVLLKIQCMNLFDIEENSREERLVDFKGEYKTSIELMSECLLHFFPALQPQACDDFIYEFFPFMYGIYPYVYPTEKQKSAMKTAGIHKPKITVYDMTKKLVIKLLSDQMKE